MGHRPPWADLPQELLSSIASSLSSSTIDLLRFRAVCKSWRRSSLSLSPCTFLSPHLPLRLPCAHDSLLPRFHCTYPKFYFLSATAVYALQPCAELVFSTPKTWLLFGDQLNPGKAKCKELSSVVGVIVSVDGISQQEVSNILEEIDILKKFMIEIDLEIQKEAKSIKRNITEVAASRQRKRGSTAQSYQIGTSNHWIEDIHGCVDCLQRATPDSNDEDDWLCREMKQRLHTHFDLSELLIGAIGMLEKQVDLQDILKSHQQVD